MFKFLKRRKEKKNRTVENKQQPDPIMNDPGFVRVDGTDIHRDFAGYVEYEKDPPVHRPPHYLTDALPNEYDDDIPKQEGVAWLIHNPGRSNQDAVRLHQSAILGRAPEADVYFSDDCVSGRHCKIFYEESQWYIIVWGINGVYLNGELLKNEQKIHLPFGSKLILGYSACLFSETRK